MTGASQFYGQSKVRFPSPSSTPKASGLTSPVLQTPKTAGSPSYFVDAFSTPRPNGQTTPAQTPLFGTFTVVDRSSPRVTRGPELGDPGFHVNHPSNTPHLPLPPVSPTRRLYSSPHSASSPSRRSLNEFLSHTQKRDTGETSMDPYQMQTPPPTRDATSRRKMRPPHMEAGSTSSNSAPLPSHASSINASQMLATQAVHVQKPFQVDTLQFSPENYHFQESDPASTPAYPQSRLFWDPSSQHQSMQLDIASMRDPSALSAQGQGPVPTWPGFNGHNGSEQQMPHHVPFATPQAQMQHRQQQQPIHSFWSPGDLIPDQYGPFSSPTRPMTTTGVDPNSLSSISSPNYGATTVIQPHQTQISHSQGDRQPYEHQLKESRREQEMARKIKQQHSRTSTSASTASAGLPAAKPGLFRSNTDSGLRMRPSSAVDSFLSGQGTEQQIVRNSSPLKRNSQHAQAALSAIPESIWPKSRTRLVVDEFGTARTVTVLSEEDNEHRQQSGLWVDSDSDSDVREDEAIPSQRSSLVFAPDAVRHSKHARIDTSAGHDKVARSSSSGSLSNIALSIKRSTSSSARQGNSKKDNRRLSTSSFGAASHSSEVMDRSWGMEGVEDGDAQLALKKVIEDKIKRQGQSPEEKLKAHNQRWSLASADMSKLQSFPFEASQPQLTPQAVVPASNASFAQTISPTSLSTSETSDMATPRSIQSSLSQTSIRCTCHNSQDDGSQMIQCESCQNWLHVHCIFNGHPIPPIFVCPHCTGFTPLARGGRVREPMRAASQTQQEIQDFASPLAGRGNTFYR